MDMSISHQGLLALMYWETVNSYSLGKGYLRIVERSEEGDTVLNITNMKELESALEKAHKNGTKICLAGVAPHDVHDGSTTVGFGDYLVDNDIPYYESKGYKLKSTSDGNVSFVGNVEFIPIDIVVEKYLLDIESMESGLKENLQKELEEDEILYYSQREFDAFIIARYQLGSLGKEGQKLILAHETNLEVWKDELIKCDAGEKRASWEVDKIMFGNGKYIDDEVDLTPLYGLYIEGIVK